MNIIIVGCGKVGETLARQLDEEGNRVTVIDKSPRRVSALADASDVMGIVGNGAVYDVLKEAGISNTHLLIAVTNSDELNILCCLVAAKSGSCRTIARVRNPEYNDEAAFFHERLGLAMTINPEFTAANEIARILRFPSAMKIDSFAKGRAELLKFKMPEKCPLEGMAVKDVVGRLHCDVLVCIVERGQEALIPNGDFRFEPRDIVSIVASPRNAAEFFRKINYRLNSVKSVMVVGGGRIGYYVSALLSRSNIKVKLVEKDAERAKELDSKLPDVSVINADAVDHAALLEEGLADMDGFVSLTNIDEENILLSMYAKEVSRAKVVTKVNRLDFDSVISRLDLDSIIYPKNLTSDVIVRYVRAMKNTIGSNMETLYNVIKGKIEAAEFLITEKSPVVGKPLMELKFREHTLVAAITRGKKVIIPRGQDVIEPGDSVVIVTDLKAISDIKDILVK
ncbi:MAG: Trk system potassium transporter TrkA [Oscillospiraceae bacterium]|nr:Trk system potassium transporter TrkA [Oscillospiraceae bacterium]